MTHNVLNCYYGDLHFKPRKCRRCQCMAVIKIIFIFLSRLELNFKAYNESLWRLSPDEIDWKIQFIYRRLITDKFNFAGFIDWRLNDTNKLLTER